MSSCTVHRLVLAAVVVAVKFSCDKLPSNKVMAASVGVPLSELNKLEVKFLCGIGYDLTVSAHDMETALAALGIDGEPNVSTSEEDSDYMVDSSTEEEAARKNYIPGEAVVRCPQPVISNNYDESGVASAGGHTSNS